ncbi:MAG: hypothetical protein P8M70_03290 [Verrucomicrobiota bacterium]|nr:hypothetical protein [Verrucomicrobiota bacterium]
MIKWGTLVSGLTGFFMVTGAGLCFGKTWSNTVTSATFAALAFGLAGHWWMILWIRSMASAQIEQSELEAIATQNAAAAKAEQESELKKETELSPNTE